MSKVVLSELNKEGRINSVAIIMDGNGRWAKARLLPRSAGHRQGALVIEKALAMFKEIGVHYLTLYAFSTENWKRPKEEVEALMKLALRYVDRLLSDIDKNGVRFTLNFLGDKSALPAELRDKCIEAEKRTQGSEFVLNIALNYGGRDEIVHAVRQAIARGEEISEKTISENLYTKGQPDPDMIIRTGGDVRISNFLLWQSAYSEIVILDTLWPDFDESDVKAAVTEFYGRKRRFGGLDKEDEK